MVFITGATGFLGKWLTRQLWQQGYRVRILARPSSDTAFFRALVGVEVVTGDIQKEASISAAMAGCQVVVHAAALFRFWGKVEDFEATNVAGTAHVLEAARRQNVQQIILISSIAVIGAPQPGSVITETTPAIPSDPYQQSKYQAEQVARRYIQEHKLKVVIVRLGALYGPGGRYAFNRLFFEEFLRGWRIQVEGGQRITFPCFVSDAAQGIEAAIRRGKRGEIYHICGQSLSHKRLNLLISQAAGKSTWRINMPKWVMLTTARLLELLAWVTNSEPFYPLNLKHYVFQDWIIDCGKAKQKLGFQPTPIEEGIRQTLAWYAELGIWQSRGKNG